MDTEKIRSIYGELQGYLSQIPLPRHPDERINDTGYTKNVKEIIEELGNLTGNNYSRCEVEQKLIPYNGDVNPEVEISEYRTKVGALISRIHSEFFYNSPPPFSGMSGTSIHLTQTQEQNQSQKMVLDFQEFINEKLKNYDVSSEERGFLEKIKSALSGVKNAAQLVGLILTTGQALGFTVEKISSIFQ
jgi:hypothetical protein